MSASGQQKASGRQATSLRQALGRLLANKDSVRAADLAQQAIDDGSVDPYVFMVSALCHEGVGQFDLARAQLRRALDLEPDNAFALATLANTFLRQGDGPSALGVYCEMLQKNITCALAFHGAGVALELTGDEDGALDSYRHAASLDPAYVDPLGALALLTLRRRDLAAARTHAEQALAIDPGQAAARLVMAQLDMDEGRAAEAVQRLAPLGDQPALALAHQAMAHRLRADAFDKLDRPAEAFRAYASSASIFRDQYAAQCGGPQPMAGLDLCDSLLRSYREAGPQAWKPAPGGGGGGSAGHVFVVGFPRSGTTLLEQVLASHPQVAALEERATLTSAIDAYLDPPVNIDAMIHMDEAAAEHWREAYWAKVRAFGVEPAGKVFVDKQPFYTLWLPLIGKLFPEAKIIVVRRDPRDIVWSCFRRPFRMTPVTYELMDLERSARLYDKAMAIVQVFIDKSSNRTFVYRHEDLVADFDAVSADLCDFLDLGWTDRLRAFADTAKARDIRTPSASQVVKGLNRDGIGAWRRYAEPMAAVMPILAPWAQAYGYAA